MKEDNFNAKKLGEIDISDWLTTLQNTPDALYDKYPFRQEMFVHHVHTKTIPLLWTSNFTTFNEDEIIQYRFEEIVRFNEPLNRLIDFLNTVYPNCVPVKIMLAKLLANRKVLPHTDQSPILKKVHRIHVPMITNEKVVFTLGDVPYYMKPGEIYEVNNIRKHSVTNGSDQDRTHLIIDMLPRSILKQSAIFRDVIITEKNKGEFKI